MRLETVEVVRERERERELSSRKLSALKKVENLTKEIKLKRIDYTAKEAKILNLLHDSLSFL